LLFYAALPVLLPDYCEQIGSKSLDAVAAVATNIVTALIKQHFGIIF